MQEQVSRQQYVGIDLHRWRPVTVRIDEAGKVLGKKQVLNDPVELSLAMAEAGEGPEVALEATYGYYWAADLLLLGILAGGVNGTLPGPLAVTAAELGCSRRGFGLRDGWQGWRGCAHCPVWLSTGRP